MNTQQLPKIVSKSKRRLGRGSGSGREKTSGRGTKGLKARGTVKQSFEGGQLPLIKRLPFVRGKSRNYSLKQKPIAVNVKYLELLPAKTTVTIETLVKHRIIRSDQALRGVKILGDGVLKKALTVLIPCSKGAIKKIESAGGTVTTKETKESKKETPKTRKKRTPKKA